MINSSSSFKSYGKIDEADHARLESTRRKTRRRITIISVSSLILVIVVVAAVVGTHITKSNGGQRSSSSMTTSVKAVCDVTLYKDTCYNSLSPAAPTQTKPQDLFKLSINLAITELSKIDQIFSEKFGKDNIVIGNCRELVGLAIDHLNVSLGSSLGDLSVVEVVEDLKTWLSAAGTYQQTCIDGVHDVADNNGPMMKSVVESHLKNCTEMTSNSLAIVSWLSKIVNSVKLRRLLSTTGDEDRSGQDGNDVPSWVTRKERNLVEKSDSLKKKARIVVAKDGSGNYKTIGDALNAVKNKSKTTTLIYVKKGVYNENVRVEKTKWNVVMVGDGMDSTLVSGSLNFVDGTPTFSSATFAVFGQGFVAREMGFLNTAGAIKHQAVALMSSADQTIFYKCRIDAFQDSLYAHANRQFYRECNIYGTVDFIFGNSAVVLQNCNILPKRPMEGQQVTITAQGKTDPNQNTGISIQNCTVWPSGNLTLVKTYLGRPWKNYSTTVYMHSMLGSLIDPTGWLPWTGDSAPDTIFYAEFENFGPGSSTKNRVKWKGLRNITKKVAQKFTVKDFLQGSKWISNAGVAYKSGL